MLLKIDRWFFLKSLFYFDKQCHLQALPKFLMLWIASSLPIIFAILVSTGASSEESGLFSVVRSYFSAPEIFLYVASFLSPLLYIVYERYREVEVGEANFSGKSFFSTRQYFEGYWLVFSVAILVLIITVLSFVLHKVDNDYFSNTVHYELADRTLWFCYIFSLYGWYLSILDGFKDRLGVGYVSDRRKDEDETMHKFASRIEGRGEK